MQEIENVEEPCEDMIEEIKQERQSAADLLAIGARIVDQYRNRVQLVTAYVESLYPKLPPSEVAWIRDYEDARRTLEIVICMGAVEAVFAAAGIE